MASLVALIKGSSGKINYASPGNGTPHHLAMELLKSHLGLDVVHVPYKGIAGALTHLVGGQVQMMFATIHSTRPMAQAGKLRMLAVTGAARSPQVPDVPTFREQGIDVMDTVDAWYGVMAPARTPPELVSRLNRDSSRSELRRGESRLAKLGLSVKTGSPEQMGGWSRPTSRAGRRW